VAPYSVYYKGVLWASTTNQYYEITEAGATDEPPALEIRSFGQEGVASNIRYPSRFVIQWRGTTTAYMYVVQEYYGGAWVERERFEENQRGYYKYMTKHLPDVTLAKWRVLAEDQYGNQSAALPFEGLVVSNPPPPAVEMSYDDVTGLLTVSEAT